ncbi:MDR/zinc-dependent alcohol dehydrogenase-like family protein [Nakamurella lactea]|uniref:hypothetical protein n=1 Tax=Nakamurella lactea TaxID=459515 RepID=UPI00041A4FA4|nr:hypothetical protein [Nakamurella lactea]
MQQFATLAVRRGLRVTGLARASDAEFVSGAGATPIAAPPIGHDFDGVLDAATLVGLALAAVRDGGRYVGVRAAAVTVGPGTGGHAVPGRGRRPTGLISQG